MNIILVKTRKDYEKPGHKYIRRIRRPDGTFHYVYKETQPRQQKIIPIKRIKKIEEVAAITPRKEAFQPAEREKGVSSVNMRMMKTSDNYFNLTAEQRQSALNQGKEKLQSFVKFLGDHGLTDRAKFRDFTHTSNREVLAKYFGLTDHEFNSESGDKLSNYVNVSFSKDGHYVTLNYADNFFFNSINKEMDQSRKPKWSLQMRMSRGITFDTETGDVVSFPYEKFFNMNEYLDGNLANLAKKMSEQPFLASEKVDGILIQAFYDKHNDSIRFGTRAQLDPETDDKGFLQTAESLMKKTGRYEDVKQQLKAGKSMILELIDPKYRVVVGYGKQSALFLHGVRDLKTSEMMNFKETQALAKNFGIETPNTHEFKSFEELADFQKNTKEDLEGFVLRFQDGSMIKAKTESYFAKLKGLKALSYKIIGETILNGDDWNEFKYERIKSEELFDVADKYRADIMKQSDSFNRFLTGFADKIIAASDWEKYGPQEKMQTQTEFGFAYQKAVKDGTIDPKRFKPEDFRMAINYLINARMKNDKKDVDGYNKKLMALTVDAVKTGSWMGSKLNELERAYTEMTLLKDFGGSLGSPATGGGETTMGGLGDLSSDKGFVRPIDPEEKKKREKQSRWP
jgi:hypothetical protein